MQHSVMQDEQNQLFLFIYQNLTQCSEFLDAHCIPWRKQKEQFLEEELPAVNLQGMTFMSHL